MMRLMPTTPLAVWCEHCRSNQNVPKSQGWGQLGNSLQNTFRVLLWDHWCICSSGIRVKQCEQLSNRECLGEVVVIVRDVQATAGLALSMSVCQLACHVSRICSTSA